MFIPLMIIFLLSFCVSCTPNVHTNKGVFSFYTHKTNKKEILPQKPQLFFKKKVPIQFYNNQFIWYCYKAYQIKGSILFSSVLYIKELD